MPQFLIERQIPGAGKLSSDELKAISQKSCSVLHDLRESIISSLRSRRTLLLKVISIVLWKWVYI